MNKENIIAAKVEEPTVRITRARVKALGTSGGILPPLKPSLKQDQKRVLRANSKRVASDENKPTVTAAAGHQHKRRVVLQDVTNIFCEKSYINCINADKIQPSKHARRGPAKKNTKVDPAVSSEIPQVQDTQFMITEETSKTRNVEPQENEEITLPINLKGNVPIEQSSGSSLREFGVLDLMPIKQTSTKPSRLEIPSKKDGDEFCDKLEASNGLGIADIDSNQKDPQMCSLYAPDIYNHILVTELERRPSANFMETVQRDINQSMRGILVDWLVESETATLRTFFWTLKHHIVQWVGVSEEYKLVPDTLYLTVNLIDRFLSENYIEKQRLQLLGVTCMLIASKYEEICAPRVEEFCFITDNTYMKAEMLKMESQVLNFLHFQLSVPTTKTFLRRSIQAAQACYKVPCVELEFLANYLAELTLTEYSFLKFLPSLIAASAVFLSRWTLDQSDHPWNPTLEHYTSYKAPELKTTVLAMQDLQLNTSGCSLNAIREKYRQHKFKCVATLFPSKPVHSLF